MAGSTAGRPVDRGSPGAVPDGAAPDDVPARDAAPAVRWAAVLSRLLGPLPATLTATAVAALVGADGSPVRTVALVTGLFGGTVVLVLVVLRAIGGPAAVTRRRALPWVLACEVVALAVGLRVGLPREVVAAFVAYVVVGVVAYAGARRNVSAHGLMAGTLTGLLLGWAPPVGAGAVLLLVALVRARVVLRQHTPGQALTGAAVGLVVGALAALATA